MIVALDSLSSLGAACRAHAQTMSAALPLRLPLPRTVTHARVELPLEQLEGPRSLGVLVADCDWLPHAAPAVIVIHGTAGSSEDAYVVRAARVLLRAGFHVIRLNQRGSGAGVARANRMYHGGFGADVDVAVRFFAPHERITSLGVLGFSLGGATMLCYAADVGDGRAARTMKLKALASVSAPIDYVEASRAFDERRNGITGFYEVLMVRSLIEKTRAMCAAWKSVADVPVNLAALERCTRIVDWDIAVTCPCHGYASLADYHARGAPGPRLQSVDIPTLIVHAADDPVVPAAAAARARSIANPMLDVVVMPAGGHVGFIEGVAQLWDASAAVARAVAHFRRHLLAPSREVS